FIRPLRAPRSSLFPYTTLFRSRTLSGPSGGPDPGVRPARPTGFFEAAVGRPDRLNVIAECKRRSPSRGVLRADYDAVRRSGRPRSEEHTSELLSLRHLVCRLLL